MNNKELKNLIKSKADKVVITNKCEDILSNVSYVENKTTHTKKSKKNIFVPVFSLAMAVIATIFVVILLPAGVDSPNDPIDATATKAKSKLVYEVAALGNAMDTQTSIRTLKKTRIDQDAAMDIADDVHNYLLTGEMILNKDNIKALAYENTDSQYEYDYRLEVEYVDNGDYTSNYTLYYSEFKKVESDDDIDEVSSYLKGIMIIDGKNYKVEGEKEVEEDEMETSLKIYKDDNSYIEISQGIESNEHEYEYEFVEDGQTVKELSLEVETEDNRKVMSISIEEQDKEKEYQFTYYDSYIECEYEDDENDIEYEITIQIHKEYYLYVFSEDLEIKINK